LPEDPLDQLEINARLATHRFVGHFSKTVSDAADGISAATQDEPIALNALRWKIAATAAVSTTAFQVSPRDALVDTWIYCVQMEDFLGEGAGSSLFGPLQSRASTAAAELAADVGELVAGFLPADELSRYQAFVRSYADEVPLRDLATPRESAVPALYAFLGIDPGEAVTTVGTLSQVVSDFGSRVSLLGDQVPNRTAWRSELFLRDRIQRARRAPRIRRRADTRPGGRGTAAHQRGAGDADGGARRAAGRGDGGAGAREAGVGRGRRA
jgi:hypothetical protein